MNILHFRQWGYCRVRAVKDAVDTHSGNGVFIWRDTVAFVVIIVAIGLIGAAHG
ncbi:hypothetical protein [Rhizorhabdus argentea]|uniref:hypothetical protein n=1 Tax=Rhizorhabdus argentea TaxID=1387174 RepID=UPI0030EDE179